jgi:hypothetical protein
MGRCKAHAVLDARSTGSMPDRGRFARTIEIDKIDAANQLGVHVKTNRSGSVAGYKRS